MKRIMWIISMLPAIMTAIAVQFMSDKVPAHYNFKGEIDRWGSKYEYFTFPIFVIAFAIFWQILISYYEKKAVKSTDDKVRAEALSNTKVLKISSVALAVFFTILHGYSLYKACVISNTGMNDAKMDTGRMVCFLCGVLFIVLGNFMPKTKKNPILGFRIKWSMYNDVTWAKSNRFGGIILMINGLMLVVISAFVKEYVAIVCMMIFIFVDVIVTMIYSYKIYCKEVKNTQGE